LLPFLAHLAGAGSLLSAVAEVGLHELPKLRVTFGESVLSFTATEGEECRSCRETRNFDGAIDMKSQTVMMRESVAFFCSGYGRAYT
jgi:hypothetical protein